MTSIGETVFTRGRLKVRGVPAFAAAALLSVACGPRVREITTSSGAAALEIQCKSEPDKCRAAARKRCGDAGYKTLRERPEEEGRQWLLVAQCNEADERPNELADERPSSCGGKDPRQCLTSAKAAVVAKDLATAAQYLREGCRLEVRDACMLGIALHVRDTKFTGEALREVLPYTGQGCKLGDADACKLVTYTRLRAPPSHIAGAAIGSTMGSIEQTCRAAGYAATTENGLLACESAPVNPFDIGAPILLAEACGEGACGLALLYENSQQADFDDISERLTARYGIPRDDPGGNGCVGRRIWDWMTPDLKGIEFRILLIHACNGESTLSVFFKNGTQMKKELAGRARAYENY